MKNIRYVYYILDGCAKCISSCGFAVRRLKDIPGTHQRQIKLQIPTELRKYWPVPNKELENKRASGMNTFGEDLKVYS